MSKDIYNPDHYLNEAGQDLFEEWYIRYPFEVFRIIMWCTAERYFRRYFNKNGMEDLRKGIMVVKRLEEYEERYSNEKYDWDRVAKNTISSIEKLEDMDLDTQDIRYMPPKTKTISSNHNPTQLPSIPNYDEVLTESEKEFLDSYYNEKYDKFEEELEEAILYGLPEKDSKGVDTDGDDEIFRTNYLKEIDVLEAVYKGLQDVLAEDSSFESRVIVDGLKTAIYDRLDALEKAYNILHWGDDGEGGNNGEEEEFNTDDLHEIIMRIMNIKYYRSLPWSSYNTMFLDDLFSNKVVSGFTYLEIFYHIYDARPVFMESGLTLEFYKDYLDERTNCNWDPYEHAEVWD